MLFPLPAEQSRNWLELPEELTALILVHLGTVDMIMTARKVCSTWRRICSDPALWRVMILECRVDYNINNVARKAVDLSCGQLIDYLGTDSLLQYISDRYSSILLQYGYFRKIMTRIGTELGI